MAKSSTSFKPGQSGNPQGGRKLQPGESITDIKKLAREYTPQAINTLVDIMENVKAEARARISAAQYLLDRGWGKCVQTMEHTGSEDAAKRPLAVYLVPDEKPEEPA